MSEVASRPRIGYATGGKDLNAPGDRRRFCHWAARRGIEFERAVPDHTYDLVVANYTADLSVWRRLPSATRLVLDLVDSHFEVPRTDPGRLLRGAVKFAFGRSRHLHLDYHRLVEETCARADAVICATDEQRRHVLERSANVHTILDFQPEVAGLPKADYRSGETLRLVWEGLPWNVPTLRVLVGALEEVRRRRPVSLRVITDRDRPLLFGDTFRLPTRLWARDLFALSGVERVDWSRETLAARVTECDLAVIPIPLDQPFFRHKPENKLVLFWRLGLPVLCSPTPAYERAMHEAGLDMTCRTTADWVGRLESYAVDEGARRDAGLRGRRFAETAHSEASLLAKWDAVIASAGISLPPPAAA